MERLIQIFWLDADQTSLKALSTRHGPSTPIFFQERYLGAYPCVRGLWEVQFQLKEDGREGSGGDRRSQSELRLAGAQPTPVRALHPLLIPFSLIPPLEADNPTHCIL